MTADGAPHRPASLDEQIARVGTADVVVAFLTYNNADTLPAVMAKVRTTNGQRHPPLALVRIDEQERRRRPQRIVRTWPDARLRGQAQLRIAPGQRRFCDRYRRKPRW